MWIEYVNTSERDNPLRTRYSGSSDVVSDYSNVKYDFMVYKQINDVGKQWIRKYGLALSKELLGIVRSKYGTIPIQVHKSFIRWRHIESRGKQPKKNN